MKSSMEASPTPTEIYRERVEGDVIAVRVSGELDLATVGDLEETVEGALSENCGGLLIDLTDCGFVDSSVLSLLVQVHRRIDGFIHPRFAVAAGEQPLELLRLTRLDQEISVFANEADAVGALRAGDAAVAGF